MIFYKGFSTINQDRRWKLTDMELVKRDLLNEFNTRKGERVMRPNFGSIIWDVLFDPMTVELKDNILQDCVRIVEADPRVKLDEVIVNEFEYGIQLELRLTFLPQNMADVMFLNFNKELNSLTVA